MVRPALLLISNYLYLVLLLRQLQSGKPHPIFFYEFPYFSDISRQDYKRMKWKHAKSLRDLLTILGVQFIVAERHVAQLGSKVLYTILASALVVRPLRR